jgi:type I restriction enzyme S subunit
MKYGKMPPKDMLADEGFPVFSGYRITGYAKEYLYDDPRVIVVARGVGGTGDVKMSPEKSWITNLSIVLDHDSRIVDKKFLLYRLGLEPLKDKLNTGTAQAQITIDSLKSYVLPLPELVAQQRIASILFAYDDLIENNRRRIHLLEQAARLLYKEWFVHLRFPGHKHSNFPKGVPEGWEKCSLGDLLTLQRGFDLPVKQRKDGPFPIYASTGINGFHNVAKVKGPGVVTGRSGSLGTVMYVSGDFWPLNTALWVKEFRRVGPLFATHLLSEMHLEQYNGGAAVPTLNRNDVHRVRCLCPPASLMRHFDEFSSPVAQQIQTLERSSGVLTKARDLLLPRLMNGEIEV